MAVLHQTALALAEPQQTYPPARSKHVIQHTTQIPLPHRISLHLTPQSHAESA